MSPHCNSLHLLLNFSSSRRLHTRTKSISEVSTVNWIIPDFISISLSLSTFTFLSFVQFFITLMRLAKNKIKKMRKNPRGRAKINFFCVLAKVRNSFTHKQVSIKLIHMKKMLIVIFFIAQTRRVHLCKWEQKHF